jgi:transposase InsO family protein
MHRTLKQYCTRPAGMNMLQQQEKFERFVQEYNYDRPHQAIEMKRPADLYKPSPHAGVSALDAKRFTSVRCWLGMMWE